MSRYKLVASSCEHDISPRCPEPKVRWRMGRPDPIPAMEPIRGFDPVADTPVLNAICDSCSEFKPK